MNEQHQEDESAVVESDVEQQNSETEGDSAAQPESPLLTRRPAEPASPIDASDALAQLFAKPRVWGTVLLSMLIISFVWAYVDNANGDIRSSEGWSAYQENIVAEFTNLQLDQASEVAGVIQEFEDKMAADGSLPWAQLFKANLLLNKALMPDTTAPQNPLNPSGNKPSLLSGNLDLRTQNLEQAISAFGEVVTSAAVGEVTLLDKIATFRSYYGIAYCEEALMIVGDPADFADHKMNALQAWKTTSESVADNVANAGLVKLVEDHYTTVLAMSGEDWRDGDSLTEKKFLSWLSKNDPAAVLAPEDDPLNPANSIDDRGETNLGADEERESALPGIDDKAEGDDKVEGDDKAADTDQ